MFAATTFEIEANAPAASIDETDRFLREYERARGLAWSTDDWEVAWAAGSGGRLPGAAFEDRVDYWRSCGVDPSRSNRTATSRSGMTTARFVDLRAARNRRSRVPHEYLWP
jgi:hypothetical protein